VTLEGLDAVHADSNHELANDPLAAAMHAGEAAEERAGHAHEGDPDRTITAFLVGLKSRGSALAMQRLINEHPAEPLTAILPGVTLQELWEITGAAEKTLFAVSVLVVVVGLAGMLVALLTSLSERRREMAVLRSVGARPTHVFALILGEAAVLTLAGIGIGVAALYLALFAGHSWLEARLGLFVGLSWPSAHELGLVALVAAAGVVIGLIPAYRIYRYSLADGMTIRV
jgi:putative ABC transport system permease protein